MDVSGEHQSDIDHDVFKVRLDLQGKPIKDSAAKKGLFFFSFFSFFSSSSSPSRSLTFSPHPPKEHELGKEEVVFEPTPALPEGYCGSCYGATGLDCCQTCDEVRAAYRKMGWTISNIAEIEQVGSSSEIKRKHFFKIKK